MPTMSYLLAPTMTCLLDWSTNLLWSLTSITKHGNHHVKVLPAVMPKCCRVTTTIDRHLLLNMVYIVSRSCRPSCQGVLVLWQQPTSIIEHDDHHAKVLSYYDDNRHLLLNMAAVMLKGCKCRIKDLVSPYRDIGGMTYFHRLACWYTDNADHVGGLLVTPIRQLLID